MLYSSIWFFTDDCKVVSKSELTEEVSEVPKDDKADTKKTREVKAAGYNCEFCGFVSNKELEVRIHMLKKHATIELMTYLSYALCDSCTFLAVKCGRKVSTAWIYHC